MKKVLILTITAVLSLTASAQGRPGSSESGNGPRHGFEQIESMKVAFFTSELDLSPEEASKFWPVYNQFVKEFREKGQVTHESFREMENASKENGKSDVEYKKLVDKYLDAKVKENELIRLYSSEFYKVLSPEKVAKLFVAEEHFRFKMIEMWRCRKGPDQRPNEFAPQTK